MLDYHFLNELIKWERMNYFKLREAGLIKIKSPRLQVIFKHTVFIDKSLIFYKNIESGVYHLMFERECVSLCGCSTGKLVTTHVKHGSPGSLENPNKVCPSCFRQLRIMTQTKHRIVQYRGRLLRAKNRIKKITMSNSHVSV